MGDTSQCSLGNILKTECHLKWHTRHENLNLISEHTEEEQKLLSWRSGINIKDLASATICSHHLHVHLYNYENKQTQCCNPWTLHKGKAEGEFSNSFSHIFPF